MMSQSVAVPSELLKELHNHLVKIDEILATLEELMDKEDLERIRTATDEYRRGELTVADKTSEIPKVLEKQ